MQQHFPTVKLSVLRLRDFGFQVTVQGNLSVVMLQLVEADNLWLKKSDSEKRSVKMSLVRQHMPQLISKFEQEQRDKLVKKSKGGQKAAIMVTASA